MTTNIVEVRGVLSVPSPEITALVRSGSSALLTFNALLLKRTKLAGICRPDGATAAATVATQAPA